MPNIKRYPGVRPFETDDQDLFFGRDRDIDDLSDLIALERLVVLFGKSGYGKSSLINAGIIPKLQDIGESDDALMLPIVVRLYSYDNAMASPIDKILAQLSKIADKVDSTDFLDTLSPEQPLWYHFKRRQTPTKRRFLLIFDQFEEFFTYPLAQQAAFKTQLAELLYQDTPQIVRESATTLSKDQRRFLAQALEVKVLFSIRADRMSQLDSMKDKLPAILQKRYELKGLTEEQARQAIEKPALAPPAPEGGSARTESSPSGRGGSTESSPFGGGGGFASPTFTYSHEALRVMTQKLSETKVAQRSGIEAFQLQILCEYLEDKIIKGEIPNNCIEPQHFADNINDIYEGYYQRLIDKLDPSVRKAAQLLIEEDLIYHNEKTGDSRRESRDSGRLLDKEGITQKVLDDLESNFLLRREVNSLGGVSYEVSHDTLIAPILASKEERQALEKADAERREAQKKQRRLLGVLLAAVLSLAVVIGVVIYVLKLRNDAVIALKIAEQEKAKAEKSLNDLLAAQKEKDSIEIQILLQKTKQTMIAGNRPPLEYIKRLKEMNAKYPGNKEVESLLNEIGNK